MPSSIPPPRLDVRELTGEHAIERMRGDRSLVLWGLIALALLVTGGLALWLAS